MTRKKGIKKLHQTDYINHCYSEHVNSNQASQNIHKLPFVNLCLQSKKVKVFSPSPPVPVSEPYPHLQVCLYLTDKRTSSVNDRRISTIMQFCAAEFPLVLLFNLSSNLFLMGITFCKVRAAGSEHQLSPCLYSESETLP